MRRVLVLLLLCCTVFASIASAATWSDALGRKVDVPATPKRIVSLVPSVTEDLFALGLGSRVVGVTEYSNFPPAASLKRHVGSYDAPNIEAIVAARPDLVIAGADVDSPVLVDRLNSLHIPVYVVYPQTLDDTIAMLKRLGEVTGVPDAGARLSASLRRTVQRAKAAVAGRQPVRTLLCEMLRPLVVAGPKTLADDLLRVAGGKNVVPPGPLRYPTWGAEGVLAADPQVIIVAPHPGGPDPLGFFRRWPELTAVKNDRVTVINADWLQFPGPRLACGLAALVKALHGIDLGVKEPACSP